MWLIKHRGVGAEAQGPGGLEQGGITFLLHTTFPNTQIKLPGGKLPLGNMGGVNKQPKKFFKKIM